MKIDLSLTATLGFAIALLPTVLGSPHSGANCNVFSSVSCTLPNGRNCNSLEVGNAACGVKTLKFLYKFCNNNSERMVFLPKSTYMKLRGENMYGLEVTRPIDGNRDCREIVVEKEIDTCAPKPRKYPMQIQVEGYVEGKMTNGVVDNGYYCHTRDFLNVFVRPKEIAFDTKPNVSLDIQCRYGNQECSRISLEDGRGCTRALTYSYIVTNKSVTSDAKIQALFDESLQSLLGTPAIIKPSDSVTIPVTTNEVNICKAHGTTITKKATVLATSTVQGIPVTVTGQNSFTLSSISPIFVSGTPSIKCTLDGSDCYSIRSCTSGEAQFQYTIKNTGDACHSIDRVLSKFGGTDPRPLAIDGHYQCSSEREACGGDVMTLTETRYINTCDMETSISLLIDFKGQNNSFEVDMKVDSPFVDDCNNEYPKIMIFSYNPDQRTRNLRKNKKKKYGYSYTVTISTADNVVLVRKEVSDACELMVSSGNGPLASNLNIKIEDYDGKVERFQLSEPCVKDEVGRKYGPLEVLDVGY